MLMVRHLLISTELLAQICVRFTCGDDRRYFFVHTNGLPPDHRVLGCSVREPNMIAIEIESDEFTDETDLPPVMLGMHTAAPLRLIPLDHPERPCWECGHRTTEAKCPNCGFDSAVQADGGLLIPPRFTPEVEAMVRGDA